MHQILADYLKIDRIHILTGASVGGHQAIEWAIMQPKRVENLILIASNARFSPWGIAFSASQRMAIEADPTFYEDKPDGGAKGLETTASAPFSRRDFSFALFPALVTTITR